MNWISPRPSKTLGGVAELEDGVVLGKGLLAFCFLLGVELTKEITHLTQTMGVSEKEV